jgi:superfamily II DNA/RNA helicase
LKRLLGSDSVDPSPFQAIIIVPTKELAVQVASDIDVLCKETQSTLSFPLVHLCITSSAFKGVKSPIIVGTPFKLLDVVTDIGFTSILPSVKYVVVDEVDRLIDAPGKYAPNEEIRDARKQLNPTISIINALITSRGGLEGSLIQFVAASATIGRPLRRNLGRLLYADKTYVDVPAIRPLTTPTDVDSTRSVSRAVGIPASIRHVLLMSDSDSNQLTKRLSTAKDLWNTLTTQRGIIFVPTPDDVKQCIG